MDSAYLGNITKLIGRYEGKISMVGTAQKNRPDMDTEGEKTAMKKNMYKATMRQHDTSESLSYAICSDKNLVQTLSNFHTPNVADEGLKRERKTNDVCERDPASVPCPQHSEI